MSLGLGERFADSAKQPSSQVTVQYSHHLTEGRHSRFKTLAFGQSCFLNDYVVSLEAEAAVKSLVIQYQPQYLDEHRAGHTCSSPACSQLSYIRVLSPMRIAINMLPHQHCTTGS